MPTYMFHSIAVDTTTDVKIGGVEILAFIVCKHKFACSFGLHMVMSSFGLHMVMTPICMFT